MKRVRVDANGDPLPESEAKPTAAAAQPEKLPGVGFNKDGTPIQRSNDERVFGATVVGGMTALHFAAREGHVDAVRALIDGGADVNLVSGGEKTSPMVEAIINGHLDLAKFLLDHGADPKLANIDRLTRALRDDRHALAPQHVVSAADDRAGKDRLPRRS